MSDTRPPLDGFFNEFGVPATVKPLSSPPVEIETVVIWAAARSDILRATLGAVDQVIDIRPTVAIRRDEVPDLPIGSLMLAPELRGGRIKTFIVNAMTPQNPIDTEIWHAIVHEAPVT